MCRTNLVAEADRCYTIGGAYTLTGNGDVFWAGALSTLAIKEAMDTGLFNAVHPDIFDVHFVSDTAYQGSGQPARGIQPPPAATETTKDAPMVDDDNLTWPWIVLSMGILVYICIVILMRWLAQRRNRRIEGELRRQRDLNKADAYKSCTLTLESEGQVPSPRHVSTVKPPAVTKLDPVPEMLVGQSSFSDSDVMNPCKRDGDPFYTGTGMQSVLDSLPQHADAYDWLADSGSSSDGEDDVESFGHANGGFPAGPAFI